MINLDCPKIRKQTAWWRDHRNGPNSGARINGTKLINLSSRLRATRGQIICSFSIIGYWRIPCDSDQASADSKPIREVAIERTSTNKPEVELEESLGESTALRKKNWIWTIEQHFLVKCLFSYFFYWSRRSSRHRRKTLFSFFFSLADADGICRVRNVSGCIQFVFFFAFGDFETNKKHLNHAFSVYVGRGGGRRMGLRWTVAWWRRESWHVMRF